MEQWSFSAWLWKCGRFNTKDDTKFNCLSTTYFKKVFTLDSSYNLDDLYGIKGSHRIDDEMIMYLNGKEIYRFNSGRFGSALINSPLVLNGYGAGLELDALTREFSVTNDKNNNLTYTQVEGEENQFSLLQV